MVQGCCIITFAEGYFKISFAAIRYKKIKNVLLLPALLDLGGRRRDQPGTIQRPPDYESNMLIVMMLHRFGSICTSLLFNRVIIKDYKDLYRFSENTGTKTGTISLFLCGPSELQFSNLLDCLIYCKSRTRDHN
jgi:hypothetical protein